MLSALRESASISAAVGGRIVDQEPRGFPSISVAVTATSDGSGDADYYATVHVWQLASSETVNDLVLEIRSALEPPPTVDGVVLSGWTLDYVENRQDEEYNAFHSLVRFRLPGGNSAT